MSIVHTSLNTKAFTTQKPSASRSKLVAARCSDKQVSEPGSHASAFTRRQQLIQGGAALAAAASLVLTTPRPAAAFDPVDDPIPVLCDEACVKALEGKEMVTLPSGLQYKDIIVGKGPSPPVGFQVVTHYVAMNSAYRIFDNSLQKGKPYDIRVGSGAVVAGLDEGLLSMKPGGIRRLFIPGNLSFPNKLKSAPGRPSIPANSPVVFDVQLLYIPGLEDDDE